MSVAHTAPPEPAAGAVEGEARWREAFIGLDVAVPVAGGGSAPYINLDNAASTPPLRRVEDAVVAFGRLYASVHRGAGYKSQVCTAAYEEARQEVLRFLLADVATQTAVFVRNTTEAINLVARTLARDGAGPVVTTVMEHHANLLPWRHHGPGEILLDLDDDGFVPLARLDAVLRENAGRVGLVAVSGASNVTGRVNDIHAIAAVAHRHGVRVMVDAAQLAPHRAIDMRPAGDPGHIDMLALSAHKMHAPYGSGVLVAPAAFLEGMPMVAGGGAVEVVTTGETVWTTPPDNSEAGSPNVLGAIAMAVAMRQLSRGFGMDALAAHEGRLTRRLVDGLRALDGVHVLGHEPGVDSLGVVSFTVAGLHHALVAAALSWEWGIGVRHGCFCAHPYLLRLLGLDACAVTAARDAVVAGDRREVPGAVRASIAPYTTETEVDRLLQAVAAVASGAIRERYVQDLHGDYHPASGAPVLPGIDDVLRQAGLHGSITA